MNQSPQGYFSGSNFGAIPSIIARIAPFLLPALFFHSGLLLALSPVPLLVLTLKNFPWISLLALATNTAFLYSLEGASGIAVGVWLWSVVGIMLPLLIRRLGKVVPSFWISFSFGIAVFYVTLSVISLQANMGVVEFVKHNVSFEIESLVQLPNSPIQKMVEEQGRDEIIREIMNEIPSAVLISYLAIFWLNLLFASRLIRGFLTASFWGSFKNPDWMVWPTLFCGTAFGFGKFALYYIGLNGFKFLLALYALQGLSIISFLLTRFKVQGFGRVLVFFGAILIGAPLILALGFFDQWFDFRKKFGQSL